MAPDSGGRPGDQRCLVCTSARERHENARGLPGRDRCRSRSTGLPDASLPVGLELACGPPWVVVVNWKTIPPGRTLEWFRELAALQRGASLGDPATLLSRS